MNTTTLTSDNPFDNFERSYNAKFDQLDAAIERGSWPDCQTAMVELKPVKVTTRRLLDITLAEQPSPAWITATVDGNEVVAAALHHGEYHASVTLELNLNKNPALYRLIQQAVESLL